jgi:putative DNA primase/helicase
MAEDKRGNGTAAETSPNNDRGPHQVAAEASEIVRAALTESSLFRMTAQGLYWDPGEEKAPTWLSPYFDVLAHTRDVDGGQWGLLLSWRDLDHRVHEWAMPLAALGGGREEIWRALLAGGLRITPTPAGREKLAQYLSTVKVQGRALAVARIGWHLRSAAAAAFVLPDRTYGESAYERIRWQTENRSETPYRCAGGLDDWRHHIGGRCKGNSRLVFGLSAGFAAPLLQIAGQESGGLHFVGSSRSGKTTILHVAGSVWGGGGGISGYLRSWRSTANSLEAVAEAHCDTLLCLDELGQVNAREAGEVAYMLANGTGKSRARRDGSARRATQWRVLFLSSGEVSLTDKMAEAGMRPRAGHEVRLVDIPAAAGAGHGAFENLDGSATAGDFADELRSAATTLCYGTPIRHYLELLIQQYAADLNPLAERLSASRAHFLAEHLPGDASGQVRSVCGRFALVAEAGKLATEFGITGWPEREASWAAAVCFRAWLARRGTAGDQEIEAGIRQVRAFIEAHGSSRFEAAWETDAANANSLSDRSVVDRTVNRVGFRRKKGDIWQYLVMPEQWRSEVAKGYDAPALAHAMIERGFMEGDRAGKSSTPIAVPGHSKMRLYLLTPKLLDGDC